MTIQYITINIRSSVPLLKMFKIFLSFLISMVVVAVCQGNSLATLVQEAQKLSLEHIQAAAAQSKHSNLRAQAISGSSPGSYIMETSYYDGNGCGGLNPRVQVSKTNTCIGFHHNNEVKYMKYECFTDTKQGKQSYYTDAACTVPDTSMTSSEFSNLDMCQNNFMLTCLADASALNLFKNVEMVVGFGDATQLANNDVKNAKIFFNAEPLKRITGIKPEDRVACNSEIAYGQCVDVTNAKSYARQPRSFTSGALTLYSRINGMGEATRVPFPMPVVEDGGIYHTVRYPVAGWYDQYFGAGTSGASMAIESYEEDEEN